jgi:alpha-methylacyl-CoA racemase
MGPLKGYKIIELAGIGPGPFCGMLLADLGAQVITVHRQSDISKTRPRDCSQRGKHSIVLNLKKPSGVDLLLKMVKSADAVFEGFRPGVVEKLGVGPEQCMAVNPKLVFGRMTGWGQYGPLSQAAGHDINYIALTGALAAVGPKGGKPIPPLNLVGDFGGGGLMLALGIVSALLEAQKSGKGQVVDAAMTDGSALLMAYFNSAKEAGRHELQRGSNMLDGGAHFYNTYETLDGKYICIGSVEPQFYAMLIEIAELDPNQFKDQHTKDKWPELSAELEKVFKTKTRAQWSELMEGSDVCFAPVLDIEEAQLHPHNQARNTYINVDGMNQPAPAPRFSRTPAEVKFAAQYKGESTIEVMKDLGLSHTEIDLLSGDGVIV